VYPFAPQAGYGGPDGLKRLIDACHAKDLAVILDVVYNHLGPEGNYLADYGPYFTDRYRTPWGAAVNYDGPDSDDVRHYVISNARYWITEYHVDGLRLDAIHGIFDFSARHIVADLADAVHVESQRLARIGLVIAESDLNDARVIAPPAEGGYGVDGQWNDDFHHALHTVLTDERAGYYQDFGRIEQLAAAIRDGFVYTGQRSSFRRRRHGNSPRNRAPSQFVVAAQTHDQIGNRARGDRLSTLIPFDALKVAAAALLLGPNVPLLIMGEEYAETAPFQYFVDHGDPALVELVRTGRMAEFASFGEDEAFPDPQDPETFARSRLVRGGRTPRQSEMFAWYRALITLRTSSPAFASTPARVRWWESERILAVHRPAEGAPGAWVILGFSPTPAAVTVREPPGVWRRRLDAADTAFGGKGALHDLDTVHVTPEGVLIHVPAYSALAFLRDPLTP
jgi:maltooligosyltrehalose trehalohydrolase